MRNYEIIMRNNVWLYIYDVTTTVPLIIIISYDNTIEIDYVTFSYGKSYATLATLIIIPPPPSQYSML